MSWIRKDVKNYKGILECIFHSGGGCIIVNGVNSMDFPTKSLLKMIKCLKHAMHFKLCRSRILCILCVCAIFGIVQFKF